MENMQAEHPFKIDWQVGDPAPGLGQLVCAIGNFDGVHTGHQHIISHAVHTAQQRGLKSAVVTFSPHPRAYFRKSDAPFLLMDESDKMAQMRALGVDYVIMVQFNESLQQLNASAFVSEVLKDAFNISVLCAGADFAFGKGREGRMSVLAEDQHSYGLEAHPVALLNDSQNMAISSSRIRAALQAGQIELATQMLGRPHRISGIIQSGDKRGRQLAFPTANLALENLLHPAFGVYAVRAWIGDADNAAAQPVMGVCNIGRRPTVNDRGVLAETHLFDFDDDIYGQRLCIELLGFIRPEQKFASLDELRAQIASDCESAKHIQDRMNANAEAS